MHYKSDQITSVLKTLTWLLIAKLTMAYNIVPACLSMVTLSVLPHSSCSSCSGHRLVPGTDKLTQGPLLLCVPGGSPRHQILIIQVMAQISLLGEAFPDHSIYSSLPVLLSLRQSSLHQVILCIYLFPCLRLRYKLNDS